MKKTTPFLNPTPHETPAPEWADLLAPRGVGYRRGFFEDVGLSE